MIRGFYTIWPDFKYLDRLVNEGGIDTLIISVYNYTWNSNESEYFDSWETSRSVFERYKGKVKLLACPVMYGENLIVPEGHRFQSKGKSYEKHWCPTSNEMMARFFSPFKEMQKQGMCDGIIYDPEHYVAGPRIFEEQIPCECGRCKSRFPGFEHQWNYRKDIMRKDSFNMGQLIYDSWWSMQCYNDAICLTEDTYQDRSKWKERMEWRVKFWKKKREMKKKHDVNIKFVPGIFIEVFKDLGDFLDQCKYLSSHCPFEGYWIYSQRMFSKNAKLTEEGMQKTHGGFGYFERRYIDEVDPNFYSKLKNINT